MNLEQANIAAQFGVLLTALGVCWVATVMLDHTHRVASGLGAPRTSRRVLIGLAIVFTGLAIVIGGIMADRPRPSTTLERAVAREYERMAQSVNEEVARQTKLLVESPERRSAQYRRARAAELSAHIDRELLAFGRSARGSVEEASARARRHGLRLARRDIREAGLEQAARAAGQSASFAFVNDRAVRVATQDSLFRLASGATDHAENARRVFRTLSESLISSREFEVNRAIIDGIALGDTKGAERKIRELFRGDDEAQLSYRRLGAKQITVGRAVMPVRHYAETVMITRGAELAVKAGQDAQLDVGLDLQQVVGTSTVNFCTRYLGLVVVLGPSRDGYPSIDELPSRGAPFHPRCRKDMRAVMPDVQDDVAAEHRASVTRFRFAQRNNLLTTDLT